MCILISLWVQSVFLYSFMDVYIEGGVVYKWRKTQFYVKIGETMCKRLFVVSRTLTCKWMPFRYYIESFYTEYVACVSMWHLSCTIGLWYPSYIRGNSICTEIYIPTPIDILICNFLYAILYFIVKAKIPKVFPTIHVLYTRTYIFN